MSGFGQTFLNAALVDNMPLTLFLGLCTFLALSRRPEAAQRLTTRTGLASRGSFCSLITAASTSSWLLFGFLMIAFLSALYSKMFELIRMHSSHSVHSSVSIHGAM